MTRLAGSSRLLRAMNQSATLALLLDRGTLTRAELREQTGLSKPTSSDVLRALTDAGLATLLGHSDTGGPGPHAEVYAVNPRAAYVVGLSLRDTTVSAPPAVTAAVTDLTGAVLARTERADAGDDPVACVRDTVTELAARAGVDPGQISWVQLAVPGAYDPRTDTVGHIDVPGWRRPGLVRELAAALRTHVAADNDVNLAAVAERHRGAARGADGFVLLWCGAGLGMAADLGGTVLRGATGSAGEIGYLPVGLRGPELQELIGGPAVLALAARHGVPGDTAADAVRAAVAEPAPPGADAFLDRVAERVAMMLATTAAILDPPLAVLAGDVVLAGGAALCERVVATLRSASPIATPVVVTALAGDAVLLGALDAGLRAVRESLVDSLRFASGPAQ